MHRPLLLAAMSLLAGCSQIVNLGHVSAPADALRPQRADRVEVFSAATPPSRAFSKYVLLETAPQATTSQTSAALRAKGGETGCDAILLRAEPGRADCVLYNGK